MRVVAGPFEFMIYDISVHKVENSSRKWEISLRSHFARAESGISAHTCIDLFLASVTEEDSTG